MSACPYHDPVTFGHTDLRCPQHYPPVPHPIRTCPPGCRAQHEHPPPGGYGYGPVHEAARMSVLASHLRRNP